MNFIGSLARKLSLLFRRNRFRSDLDEEMAFHREQAERELIASGLSPQAARIAAMRTLGNPAVLKEKSHEVVRFRAETIVQDLRFALRQFRKNPGFALTAVFILALGIASSVAIFAFVDAVLIKPLPYDDPSHLVALFESTALGPRSHLSYLDYLDWKRENKVFSSLNVYAPYGFARKTATGLVKADGGRVSAGFFHTLGVTPVLGRDFDPDEDGPDPARVALISYSAWQKFYAGSPDVLGQTIVLDNNANTIVGVLPRDFSFKPAEPADFWTILKPPDLCGMSRGCHALYGVARLKDGVSFANAFADIMAIAQQLEKRYPDTNRNQVAFMLPLTDVIVGDIRPVLIVALCGGILLLLTASVNIAGLLLVLSESRKREIAIRSALGASSPRLARQFVTEGLLLAAIGGGLGLVIAHEGVQLLVRLAPENVLNGMPYLRELTLNGHLVAYGLALTVLAGFFFSFASMSRQNLTEICDGLSRGGRGAASIVWRRLGANLVVIELATAMVLLNGSGLLGKSFYRLLHADIGMQPDHLASVHIEGQPGRYDKRKEAIALEHQVVDRIQSLPGVTSVGLTTRMPLSDADMTRDFRIVDRPYHGEHNEVMFRYVSSGYMATLKTRLISGRYFRADEDSSKPAVAIVNRTLARQYFLSEDPVGKQITFGGDRDPNMLVVGVIDDIQEGQLDTGPRGAVYMPFDQGPNSAFSLIARTSLSDEALLPTLVGVLHGIDPAMEIYDPATMNQRIHDAPSTYLHRSSAWLVGGFAAMALPLGVIGLYGVVAYSVSQRTREIGVRMALGAQRGAIYSMVMRQAGLLTAIGIVLGLACSIAAAMGLRGLLFGVAAWDASTLAAVALLLAAASLAASFLPARRAASVNPTDALRAE